MKKLITIYEDKDQLIEVHPSFFTAYEELLTPFFRVGVMTQDLLMGLAAEKVLEKEIASPNDVLICSRKIYILEEEEPVRLEKSFEVFEDQFEKIIAVANFPAHIKEIEEQINNEKEFFCEIFERDIYDVKGYLCQVKNGKIYMVFFTYDEDLEVF